MRLRNIILLLGVLIGCISSVRAEDALSQGEIQDSVEMSISERYAHRGLVDMNNVFVPKGQWIIGGTASYSTHKNDGYKLLIVEDIMSKGYTFKVSPMVAYALSNNMAIGARMNYGRTFLRIDSASISLGDAETGTNLKTDFYYALKHSYSVGAIWRQYIPLGKNRRFALFNEMQLAVGGSQSKFAADSPVRGTYSTSVDVGLSINPGVIAFATNDMAIEVNVGIMGVQYSRAKQVHNQVDTGKTKASFMNFSVNLLSIGLGVSFYL